jgi:glycosyltransferase involved in cell wall biosynthesis
VISRLLEGVDVIEGFCSDLLATATVAAGRRRNVPVVLTPLAHRNQWADDVSSARAYARADAILAMLQPDAELYRELGVNPERIHEVGVPVRQVQAGCGHRLREERQLEGPLVLFLGRRDPYKGVDVLLAASAQIKGKVAIVGPGRSLPVNRPVNVLDVGPVSHEERDAWIDAANVLVLPSRGETFGSVVVEAWSAETPVVTSDHPALRTLVERGGGGLAVPARPDSLATAIRSLLEDPILCRRLGRSGYECWRSHYTTDVVTGRHEAVFSEALSRNPPGALPAAAPGRESSVEQRWRQSNREPTH